MSKYMAVLLLSLFIPLLFSFWPGLKFWKNIKPLSCSILIVLFIFGAWDSFAAWRGHWSFAPDGVLGFKFINLPVEEWLFFVVITFCCIFTWEALNYIKRKLK